jgi:hypothetical protein
VASQGVAINFVSSYIVMMSFTRRGIASILAPTDQPKKKE